MMTSYSSEKNKKQNLLKNLTPLKQKSLQIIGLHLFVEILNA